MRVLGMLGLAFAVGMLAAPANADYPDKGKTIRIVVPYTPGGFNDTLGRIVAQKFTDDWGVPAVVENRPGGGTLIGSDAVAKAPADGYTLLFVPSTFAIAQLTLKVGAGTKLCRMTRPSISGPSCILIGVTRSPIIVPPNIFGLSPISAAARSTPTVSGG